MDTKAKIRELENKLNKLLFPKDNKWRIDEINCIKCEIEKLKACSVPKNKSTLQ